MKFNFFRSFMIVHYEKGRYPAGGADFFLLKEKQNRGYNPEKGLGCKARQGGTDDFPIRSNVRRRCF